MIERHPLPRPRANVDIPRQQAGPEGAWKSSSPVATQELFARRDSEVSSNSRGDIPRTVVEPTDGTDAADRLEDAERRLTAIVELASGPVLQRLEDVERRLALIAGLASGPVTPAGTPESNLMDAEERLMQIHEIAKGDEAP